MARGASLPALLAAVCLAACSTSGTRFPVDSVSKIRPGVTTRHDVQTLFGTPTRTRVSGSGTTTWTYVHVTETRRDTGMLMRFIGAIAAIFWRPVHAPINVETRDETQDVLTVYFNVDGVVDDYTYERDQRPTRRVY